MPDIKIKIFSPSKVRNQNITLDGYTIYLHQRGTITLSDMTDADIVIAHKYNQGGEEIDAGDNKFDRVISLQIENRECLLFLFHREPASKIYTWLNEIKNKTLTLNEIENCPAVKLYNANKKLNEFWLNEITFTINNQNIKLGTINHHATIKINDVEYHFILLEKYDNKAPLAALNGIEELKKLRIDESKPNPIFLISHLSFENVKEIIEFIHPEYSFLLYTIKFIQVNQQNIQIDSLPDLLSPVSLELVKKITNLDKNKRQLVIVKHNYENSSKKSEDINKFFNESHAIFSKIGNTWYQKFQKAQNQNNIDELIKLIDQYVSQPETPSGEEKERFRILVVDDKEQILQTFRNSFGEDRVITAQSIEELKGLKTQSEVIPLAILDIALNNVFAFDIIDYLYSSLEINRFILLIPKGGLSPPGLPKSIIEEITRPHRYYYVYYKSDIFTNDNSIQKWFVETALNLAKEEYNRKTGLSELGKISGFKDWYKQLNAESIIRIQQEAIENFKEYKEYTQKEEDYRISENYKPWGEFKDDNAIVRLTCILIGFYEMNKNGKTYDEILKVLRQVCRKEEKSKSRREGFRLEINNKLGIKESTFSKEGILPYERETLRVSEFLYDPKALTEYNEEFSSFLEQFKEFINNGQPNNDTVKRLSPKLKKLKNSAKIFGDNDKLTILETIEKFLNGKIFDELASQLDINQDQVEQIKNKIQLIQDIAQGADNYNNYEQQIQNDVTNELLELENQLMFNENVMQRINELSEGLQLENIINFPGFKTAVLIRKVSEVDNRYERYKNYNPLKGSLYLYITITQRFENEIPINPQQMDSRRNFLPDENFDYEF